MDREGPSDLEFDPEEDPEKDLEAGLTGLSPETVVALDAEAAAEHGVPGEVEIEDVPLEEDDLLKDEEGGQWHGLSRRRYAEGGHDPEGEGDQGHRGRRLDHPRGPWVRPAGSRLPLDGGRPSVHTSMLVHGRKGEDPIPGPLCNFEVLPGDGGVKLIAAGRANHNAPAKTGFSNSVSFGIEAAGPSIVDAEFKVYHALVAAICKVYKIPVNQGVRDHHEAAGGLPGRKPDITVPVLGITLSSAHNMNTFRNNVSRLLGEQEDDFMALFDNMKEFKAAVREVINEELDRRLDGGVVKGQKNVGGTLAVIADHVDDVLREVRKP